MSDNTLARDLVLKSSLYSSTSSPFIWSPKHNKGRYDGAKDIFGSLFDSSVPLDRPYLNNPMKCIP